MLPVDYVGNTAPARLPVQQPVTSAQSVATFNDVLYKTAPGDVTTPTTPQNSPFALLTSALQNVLKSLLSDALTNTDPARAKTNQVIQAATESILWSDEANRLQGIAQQAQAATQAAKTKYGENSPQYLTALANQRAAEAAAWAASAKANQAQAQLNVYAADPSYKSAMIAAKGIMDAGLKGQGLQWQIPKPQGTLSQAQQRLTQAGLIVQQATQAQQEYQQAADAFSQLPKNYVPGTQYQPPQAIITAPGGPSYDTVVKQERLAHDRQENLYASGVLHLANGNMLLTDATVESLKLQLTLLKPGTKEYTAINNALTAALSDQTTAASNQQVAQAQYNLVAANVNVDQLELQKGGIEQQALAAIHETNPYWFDPNGFTNLNNDYSGKLQSVKVITKSDGQLYAEFTYEHRTMEIQLTFAPGKEPPNLTDSRRAVDAAWASFNAGANSPNTCSIYTDVVDQARHEQVLAQQALNDLQLKDTKQLITQLTQTYQDAVAKYGSGVPLGLYAPGNEPGTPNGPKVAPQVSAAQANLIAAQQLYGQLQANGAWLGFLMTQPLSNFADQDEQENLRKKFFVENPGERQREFNQLAQAYGKPILLQQTPGSQLTAWDTPTKLQNGVGIALNIQPDNPAAWTAGDMSQQWYSGQSLDAIKQVTDKIQQLAGKGGKVQVLPTFLALDQGGLVQSALFAVTDAADNQRIVDSTGRDYKDLSDYQHNNELPGKGTLYLPNNLSFSQNTQGYQLVANVQPTGTPYNAQGNVAIQELKIDGPSKAWGIADGTAGVVTSVATILSFTPLAPIAVPVAIAGGTYLGVRAGMQLADMAEHGQSWLSKEGMLNLAMVATSALPVAGGGFRLAGLLRSGMEFAPALRTGFGAFYFRNPLAGPFPAPYAADAHLLMADGGALFTTAKGLDIASMSIGTPLMLETGYDTIAHWNELSGFDKFSNALSFASGIYATGMGARGRTKTSLFSQNSGSGLQPAGNNQAMQWYAQPQIPHRQGQTGGGGRRLTYIPVRDPVSGNIVQATVFKNVQPLISGVLGTDGIVDASHIYDPTKPLSKQRPRFILAADGTGIYILPFIAGAAPSPIERFIQGSKRAGQAIFVKPLAATGHGLVWVGKNVIKPGWRTGAAAAGVIPPAAELILLPSLSKQGVADWGNWNFAGRGPGLIVSAVAAARGRLNPLTKTGFFLRVGAGTSFWMNAVNNYWKVAEGLSTLPPHPSLVHNLLPIISQGFFAVGQTLLGGRSLMSAQQAARLRRYATMTKVDKVVTVDVKTGDSWSLVAKKSGIPLNLLPVINPGDTLKIYEKRIVGPTETLQSIAADFGISDIRSITRASGLLPWQVTPGTPIVVPHDITVAQGDSVNSLAKQYGDRASQIRIRNNLGTATTDQTVSFTLTTRSGKTIKVPKWSVKIPVKAGTSWRWISLKTGIPLDLLPVINPGDTLKINEKRVVGPTETLQSIAADFGISDIRVISRASGLFPSQITPGTSIVVPHDITVAKGDTVKSLAKKYGDRPSAIRSRNNLGTVQTTGALDVPLYLWEANTKTSRWLQVTGAYSMAAASGTLFFVDLPKWGPLVMAFAPADALIATGTAGTATLSAIPNKKAGTLARRFPKTLAVFQSMSASALAWKGLGHELAQHDPGGILPPDIQKTDQP